MAVEPDFESSAINDKLSCEQAHLEALERMHLLEPHYLRNVTVVSPISRTASYGRRL